jgi:enolase
MQTQVTLPFIAATGRRLTATVSANIITKPNPLCLIYAIEFSTADSGPMEAFTLDDTDLARIEEYIWMQVDKTLAEVNQLIEAECDGFDACDYCSCSNDKLH